MLLWLQKNVKQKSDDIDILIKQIEDKKKLYIEKKDESHNNIKKEFEKIVAQFFKDHKIILEPQIQEFKYEIKEVLGKELKDFTFSGKSPFKEITPYGYYRIRQQYNKHRCLEYKKTLLESALILASRLNLTNAEGLASCHEIIWQIANLHAKKLKVRKLFYSLLYCSLQKQNSDKSKEIKEFLNHFLENKIPTELHEGTFHVNDTLQNQIVKRLDSILNKIAAFIEERKKKNLPTRCDYLLINEDTRTVAASYFYHANKYTETFDIEVQIRKTHTSLCSDDPKRDSNNLTIGQDGKTVIPEYTSNP